MRQLFAVSLLLTCGTVAVAAPAPKESWGKAGVSLTQYRQDALDCGLKGYYTDISQTQDAKVFVNASKQLDSVTTGAMGPTMVQVTGSGDPTAGAVDQLAQYANQQQHIVDSVHADSRFRNIKRTLTSNTEQCLAAHGYSRFALTAEQRKALSKLKAGSDQRREYLWNLASDPEVLAKQPALAPASR